MGQEEIKPEPMISNKEIVEKKHSGITAEIAETIGENSMEKGKENLNGNLNPENQSFFDKMSNGGKEIAHQAYEMIYKIPGVNKAAARLEIAYNQFWVDRHEKKASGHKVKIADLDKSIDIYGKSKEEMRILAEDLKKNGISGHESLGLKMNEVDRETSNLNQKKENAQKKFEEKELKMKSYADRRDEIAKKLTDYYDEKLGSLEKKLDNLDAKKNRAELLEVATIIKNKELEAKIDWMENKKSEIAGGLKRAGMSEKKIGKFEGIKDLENRIIAGREKIKTSMADTHLKKTQIDIKISKIVKKVELQEDKRKEFENVKERKTSIFNAAKEDEGMARPGRYAEAVRATTEVANEEIAGVEPEGSGKKKSTEQQFVKENTAKAEKEMDNDNEKHDVKTYISKWNSFLKGIRTKEASSLQIGQDDFCEKTGLKSTTPIFTFLDFSNVLKRYCTANKMPEKKLPAFLEKFFENKIKVKKQSI